MNFSRNETVKISDFSVKFRLTCRFCLIVQRTQKEIIPETSTIISH